MALLPEGSELLIAPNSPGFGFQIGSVLVFPGVPVLLERLLEAHRDRLAGRPGLRRVVATGLREGVVAGPLAALARAHPEVSWGSYPILEAEGWRLELVLRAPEADALRRAETALHRMLAALGESRPPGDFP
jgi:molybdopterin-biosynthesis enzyme MoeA-like protein